MGKALIIKGADFSSVSVGQVLTEYNPIGTVDLTQYENLHFAVNSPAYVPSEPYKVTFNLSTCDTFDVPVIPGERYKVKYCSGYNSLIVGGLSGLTPEFENVGTYQILSNCIADIYEIQDSGYGEYTFTVPAGVLSIVIIGRNSSHSGFVSGYALTLTRLS